MTFLNPLAMILSQKPMDGTNYNQWKTNLYIVLTTPRPNELAADASHCSGRRSIQNGKRQILQFVAIFLSVLPVICRSKYLSLRVEQK